MADRPAEGGGVRPGKSLRFRRLFRRDAGVQPAQTAKKRRFSGDVVIIGMGIALGLTCAVFPWYIFFNPEKFGVTPLKFAGGAPSGLPSDLLNQKTRIGAPWNLPDGAGLPFDLFPTGTISPKPPRPGAADPGDQPFPGDARNTPFDLIHVANGRAMIEDADGLWVVSVGSSLPDDSRVRSIERRNGKWVLVTSTDRVVQLVR